MCICICICIYIHAYTLAGDQVTNLGYGGAGAVSSRDTELLQRRRRRYYGNISIETESYYSGAAASL